jgi:hypothetical protein
MDKSEQVYVLGGIAFVSELPLPELREHAAPIDFTLPKINIRIGSVPFALPGGIEVDHDCLATPTEYLLRVPGIATYRASHGAEVVVEPDRCAIPLDIRAFLLGTVFAVLCHQRGLLPLHASAISTGNGVAAFLARSGQGKSSLVANLANRGFRIVADDICLVDTNGTLDALVIPSAPWLKLWRASLQQLGQRIEGLDQVFSEDDKYRFPIKNGAAFHLSGRQPLRKLIFLGDRDRDEPAVSVKEVGRVHALPLLMNQVHQAYLVAAIGQRQESFLRCGRVLSHARAYQLNRPWGFQHMDQTIDAIETLLLEG